LRQSIWKHLIELSKEGITVIITTHYIEEARSANLVAFMRQGVLLEEGNPEVLMKQFDLSSLEQVFLHLCSKESPAVNHNNTNGVDSEKKIDEINDEINLKEIKISKIEKASSPKPSSPKSSSPKTPSPKQNGVIKSCNGRQKSIESNIMVRFEKRNHVADHFARTSALFWKNATRMFRNLPVLIFTLLVPSIQGMNILR